MSVFHRRRAAHAHYDYTRGSLGRGLARLALPSCGEQVAWNVDAVVELYWVGKLGPEYLAAVSLCFMMTFFIRAVPLGARIAGGALVAQRVGAGDDEGAALMAGQSITITILYTSLLGAAGYLLAPWLMALLTTDPRVRELGAVYFRVSFIFFIFYDTIATLAHVLRGAGEPGYSLAGMAASAATATVLMPFLVFGWGPLPGMGIGGAPLAVGVGRIIGTSVVMAFLFSGRSRLHLRLDHLRPDGGVCWRICVLGWPAAAQNLLERGSNLILVRILSLFGPVTVAAFGVSNRITNVSRMPAFGVQAAVRTLVGQNLGAGLPERAVQSVRLSMWLTGLFMGSVTVGLFWFAPPVVLFFGLAGEAADVGSLCLRILAVSLLFESARRVLAGAFHGAANAKPPMVVEGIVRWVVEIPLGYLAAVTLGMGGAGVWWTIAGGQVLAGAALFGWFFWWSAEGLKAQPLHIVRRPCPEEPAEPPRPEDGAP
ncbi:MAG: MATE family efflux transporter [Candidatus Tectomicrobia bacterium]|nr:MATE family efflux transporter [Candidatus Tectomicrobia bacterium]